jgi:hypothetical protein
MEEREAFHPDTVFAHEDGRYLVFVDLKSAALLLFDGRSPSSASLLALPDEVVKESDATKAVTRTCVACSQGSICVLHMDHHHGEVTLWSLREQPQQWVRVFQIQSDEILWSDHSLGSIPSLACAEMMMGPLDPTNQYKLTIYAPDASTGFIVQVDGNKLWPQRAKFCGQAATAHCKGSCLEILVWKADPTAIAQQGPRSAGQGNWVKDLTDRSKRLGTRAVKVYCKHIDKIQPVAQLLGYVAGFFGVPHASALGATASGLVALNKAADSGEELHRWWRAGPPLDLRVVGNEDEARLLIKEWNDSGRPKNMVADPDPDLNTAKVNELREVFIRHDAKALFRVPDLSEYEMVSRGFQF